MESNSDITKSVEAKNTSSTQVQQDKATSVYLHLCEMNYKNHLHDEPSCDAIDGITFDFCRGYRLSIPVGAKKKYRVRFFNEETGSTLFDGVVGSGDRVFDTKIYYRKIMLCINDAESGAGLFYHRMILENKPVMVFMDVDTIGDAIAWFRPVELFRLKHKCRMILVMRPGLIELFKSKYPNIEFITIDNAMQYRPYAAYYMGINYDNKYDVLPYDFRNSPLNWVGYNILGLDPRECNAEEPPLIDCDEPDGTEAEREIKEPYVCIATMASGMCKLWWHPFGWDTVVKFLKASGYRVIDIDGDSFLRHGFWSAKIPAGAEDFTGKTGPGKSLKDRARMLKHCDFFVGLGSGLSWLAWAMHKPVVLISGFSEVFEEFYTPYRVINRDVCHGCFNDITEENKGLTDEFCPRHHGTKSQFCCTARLSPWQVMKAISDIPEYQERIASLGLTTTIVFDKKAESEPFSIGIGKAQQSAN